MSNYNNQINAAFPLYWGHPIGPTTHGVIIGEGTSAVNSIVLTAGQVLIGTTASDPAAATLTPGTNIAITSATGAITINTTATTPKQNYGYTIVWGN